MGTISTDEAKDKKNRRTDERNMDFICHHDDRQAQWLSSFSFHENPLD